jgi:4-hydroxybenzoate polyprenyltransferase
MYNDLGGGDGFLRDFILSPSFAMFHLRSLRLALGSDATVGRRGIVWICIVSGVILTSMHVQDFKDLAGDRARDRKTVPLIVGPDVSCRMIACFILA